MPAPASFDYVIVRVVPRVEREEFINVGVVLHAPTRRFLGCEIALDGKRLGALDPALDVAMVRRHLDAMCAVCAGASEGGPVAALTPSERFHWLAAPRSAVIQTSPVHGGLCDDPAAELRRLYASLVASPA